jgi:hypothetical protein
MFQSWELRTDFAGSDSPPTLNLNFPNFSSCSCSGSSEYHPEKTTSKLTTLTQGTPG